MGAFMHDPLPWLFHHLRHLLERRRRRRQSQRFSTSRFLFRDCPKMKRRKNCRQILRGCLQKLKIFQNLSIYKCKPLLVIRLIFLAIRLIPGCSFKQLNIKQLMSPVSPIFHIVSTVNSWSQTCFETVIWDFDILYYYPLLCFAISYPINYLLFKLLRWVLWWLG